MNFRDRKKVVPRALASLAEMKPSGFSFCQPDSDLWPNQWKSGLG